MFTRAFKIVLITVAASLAVLIVSAQDDSETQAKIESAMSAAPVSIAQDATILDRVRDADGKFIVLREGSNGWSCLPDSPQTDTNDPICVDETFLGWIYARIAKEAPVITTAGISYQLQGGQTNSNDDPFATEPAEDFYATTAPIMMIIFPPGVDLSGYPADVHGAEPFIMFGGTPYEHLMIVLGDETHESES